MVIETPKVILEKKKNKYSWQSSLGFGQSIINE